MNDPSLNRPTHNPLRLCWALGLLATAAGACVFTDPINMPPTILGITATPSPLWRATDTTFRAQVQDDQTEAPTLEWARKSGGCDSVDDKSAWPAPGDRTRGPMFLVPASDTLDPYCVWVVARDKYGAEAAFTYAATPMNHPPQAMIIVESPMTNPPYPIKTQFHLRGVAKDVENDPLKWQWTVTQPDRTAIAGPPCQNMPGDDRICLDTTLPGTYHVELAVSDADTTQAPPLDLIVGADRLPCIKGAQVCAGGNCTQLAVPDGSSPFPRHMTPDGDQFQVTNVDDDLDALPGDNQSQLQFSWSWALVSDSANPQNDILSPQPKPYDWRTPFALPSGSVHFGDLVRVRVEVKDSANGLEIDHDLGACSLGNDTCAPSATRASNGGDDCYLRVTWTLRYEL